MPSPATSAPAARLSDLDLRLLRLISRLRIVTQGQLERLHPDVAPRTIRYRTRRLYEQGLVGRSRPYRDQGTAPFHLWPTNRGDALARRRPAPGRGERRAPNPLFVAHTAAVAELYVLLKTATRENGFTLAQFIPEGRAREDFTDREGHPRAIVPDARITLRNGQDEARVANVEVDLGTMTHARLRAKLRGYLAHARVAPGAPPTLLFLTTSQGRNERFLRSARNLSAGTGSSLSVLASASVNDLASAMSTATWVEPAGAQPRRLVDALWR